MIMPRTATMLSAALAALLALAPAQAQATSPFALTFKDPAAVCAAETARQEQAMGIPQHLLKAISIVESGRFDKARKASFAWPWTVTAEGKGRFLPSKSAAIAEVLALRARGVRNIDVGCMQINLHFHPDAFADLNEAFEPAANVAYGARFLKTLYGDTESWMRAASHYHSQTPELATAYAGRVTRAWNEARLSAKGEQARKAETQMAEAMAETARAKEEWEARRAAQASRLEADRDEARRLADEWRQARIAAYLKKKAEKNG